VARQANGERKEKTEWHRVICFNEGLTGGIEQYLAKVSLVMIEGKVPAMTIRSILFDA